MWRLRTWLQMRLERLWRLWRLRRLRRRLLLVLGLLPHLLDQSS
jgi:hypothetical protein